MKSRETMIQLFRFKADEKRRKLIDLENMIRDFESMTRDLDRQIEAEHEKTGVSDSSHFKYSTLAKATANRRDNLSASVQDLRAKLADARQDYELAMAELKKAEQIEDRDEKSQRQRINTRDDGADRTIGQV
jgi:flagellar export protein FliJ